MFVSVSQLSNCNQVVDPVKSSRQVLVWVQAAVYCTPRANKDVMSSGHTFLVIFGPFVNFPVASRHVIFFLRKIHNKHNTQFPGTEP